MCRERSRWWPPPCRPIALSLVGELRPTWFALGAFVLLSTLLGSVSRPAATPLIAGDGGRQYDLKQSRRNRAAWRLAVRAASTAPVMAKKPWAMPG